MKDDNDLHEWLFAVPLVHFLTGVSEPFNSDVLLMEEPKPKDDTWWGANGFPTKQCEKEILQRTGERRKFFRVSLYLA